MSKFELIESIRKDKGYVLFALIDPDSKNDKILDEILNKINNSIFDAVLVGGSSIIDDKLISRLIHIKNNTDLPLLLFPGSSNQVTNQIDSMLYLNLISGRNPKYLIEEQVESAIFIKENNIETIPTAYILLDGGTKTSVHIASNTAPLDMNDYKTVLSHALAGEYLGNKIIYFDCGSGSKRIMDYKLLNQIKKSVNIPIMVGGGIKKLEQINKFVSNGASYVVIGNVLENSSLE